MSSYFVHPAAICESDKIGESTKIWAFSHVLSGAKIGRDVNINDHVFIEDDVIVGDRVTVKCGVQLWNGTTIEDDVFIGPNVTFTNDMFPRSKKFLESHPRTLIRKGASVGAGTVLLPGVIIGQYALIGAGSVVTRDVPPFAKVYGNPARIFGYVNPDGTALESLVDNVEPVKEIQTEFQNSVYSLKNMSDLRGKLMAIDFEEDLPFVPKRFFLVYSVPTQKVRGEHAHKKCQQFLLCLAGEVKVIVDDGTNRREFLLNSTMSGIYMPAMTWGTQYSYSKDAVLGVFASDPYDADDYIRDYEEFRLLISES